MMKKKITFGILITIVMLLLFSEPTHEENWFMVFFISKALAFIGGYGVIKLAKMWEI